MDLATSVVDDCVRRALAEDLGARGDVTTSACVAQGRRGRAKVIARASGIVAGLALVAATFRARDAEAEIEVSVRDGDHVDPGMELLRVAGTAAGILSAERTALNFLQRLSGIATTTRAFVDAIRGSGARVLDTRKTTPGLRALEKYAVRVGGGANHRIGLFDQILIKENHFALSEHDYEATVRRAVAVAGGVPVVAEARDRDEAMAAVRGGAGVVLLDNFAPGAELRDLIGELRSLAARRTGVVEFEVSGGIRLQNVAAFAACGVDRLSIGALTHSAPAFDCSLLVEAGA